LALHRTKAFHYQLTALTMLTIALAKNGPAAAEEDDAWCFAADATAAPH